MARQSVPQGRWRALIEKNSHVRRGERAASRMFEHGANLFTGDAICSSRKFRGRGLSLDSGSKRARPALRAGTTSNPAAELRGTV
jgi:hypothetical protein